MVQSGSPPPPTYLIGSLLRPVQTELGHGHRQADPWDSGGQDCPDRPAVGAAQLKQLVDTLDFLLKGAGGRGHNAGGNQRRDVDLVQEILASGPGYALVQNPEGSAQVLLQVETDQR